MRVAVISGSLATGIRIASAVERLPGFEVLLIELQCENVVAVLSMAARGCSRAEIIPLARIRWKIMELCEIRQAGNPASHPERLGVR
jgi:hypothetical protein